MCVWVCDIWINVENKCLCCSQIYLSSLHWDSTSNTFYWQNGNASWAHHSNVDDLWVCKAFKDTSSKPHVIKVSTKNSSNMSSSLRLLYSNNTQFWRKYNNNEMHRKLKTDDMTNEQPSNQHK